MAVAQKGMQKSTKKLVDEEVIPVFCVPEHGSNWDPDPQHWFVQNIAIKKS